MANLPTPYSTALYALSIPRILSVVRNAIAYFYSICGPRGTLRIRPSSDIYALCLRVGGCVTRPITMWEHPYDGTPSVTQHIQFSILPHSKTLIHASNQTAIISPLYITATHPFSFYFAPIGPFGSSHAKPS